MSAAAKRVALDYVNHAGLRAERVVIPDRMLFGTTEWHPEEQWLLVAWDCGKDAWRTFALKEVRGWRPA